MLTQREMGGDVGLLEGRLRRTEQVLRTMRRALRVPEEKVVIGIDAAACPVFASDEEHRDGIL